MARERIAIKLRRKRSHPSAESFVVYHQVYTSRSIPGWG